MLVRRIDGSKTPVALADVVAAVTAALEADQQALYDEALARREARTVDVSTLDEAIEAAGDRLGPGAVVGGRRRRRGQGERRRASRCAA